MRGEEICVLYGATADKVRAADTTALTGFSMIEVDLWLWEMMTGGSTRLKSTDITITLTANPGPWALSSVCGDTNDMGEVKAEWEASRVLGGDEGHI